MPVPSLKRRPIICLICKIEGEAMPDDNERWSKFLECVCWDSSTMSLCRHTGDNTIVSTIITQCEPYALLLAERAFYFLVAAVLAFIVFVTFLICRCACGVCGGIRPSYGYCTTSQRRRFPGYTYRSVLLMRLGGFVALVGTLTHFVILSIANASLNDSMSSLVGSVSMFVSSVDDAAMMAQRLFRELPGLPGSLLNSVDSLAGTIQTFAHAINTAFDVIGTANGNSEFGRTQIVTVVLGACFWFMMIGCVTGTFGIVLRGILHPSLAFLLILMSFAVMGVALGHMLIYFILDDSCRYVNGLLEQASGLVGSVCGGATTSMATLLGNADADVGSFECSNPSIFDEATIATVCSKYFSCAAYDACRSAAHDLVTVENISQTLMTALLLMNGSIVPNMTLPMCVLTDCGGNDAARGVANRTLARVTTELSAISAVRTTVLPFATCRINVPTLTEMTHSLCSSGNNAMTLAWGSSSFFCFNVVCAFLFVVGGKRFASRNLRTSVLKRRLRAHLKHRGYKKKEVEEIIKVTDFAAISRSLDDAAAADEEENERRNDDTHSPLLPANQRGSPADPFSDATVPMPRSRRRSVEKKVSPHREVADAGTSPIVPQGEVVDDPSPLQIAEENAPLLREKSAVVERPVVLHSRGDSIAREVPSPLLPLLQGNNNMSFATLRRTLAADPPRAPHIGRIRQDMVELGIRVAPSLTDDDWLVVFSGDAKGNGEEDDEGDEDGPGSIQQPLAGRRTTSSST